MGLPKSTVYENWVSKLSFYALYGYTLCLKFICPWVEGWTVGGRKGGPVGDYNITNGPNRSAEAELVIWGQVWQQLVLYKTE